MEYRANNPFPLSGILNFRELGGYKNLQGMTLQEKRIIRSGDPSFMTPEDQVKISEYGIKNCIDLRIDKEIEVPNPFESIEGATYYHVALEGKVDISDPSNMMYKLYVSILEECMQKIRHILELIADADGGVVFHCTAGKDRTGLIAMMILKLCDVDDEQVIADYVTSEKNNYKQIQRQLKDIEAKDIKNVPMEIFMSKDSSMRQTLAYVMTKYGGIIGYMKEIGLSEEKMDSIRQKLLG